MNSATTIHLPDGLFAEDVRAGMTFDHRVGLTVRDAMVADFLALAYSPNPLAWNAEYARAMGFADAVCPAGLVLNVVLCQSLDPVALQATANLGYRDVAFGAPVSIGDTITARTTVVETRPSPQAAGHGVVVLHVAGRNQRGEPVVTLRRSLLLKKRHADREIVRGEIGTSHLPEAGVKLPEYEPNSRPRYAAVAHLTDSTTWFEDLRPGTIVRHGQRQVIGEHHMRMSAKLGDRGLVDATGDDAPPRTRLFPGMLLAICLAMGDDLVGDNALAEVRLAEAFHHAPVFAGDTIWCESEILTVGDYGGGPDLGLVTVRVAGYKSPSGTAQSTRFLELKRELAVKRRSHYR